MLTRTVANSASSCDDTASNGSSNADLPPVAICGTCSFARCLALALKSAGFTIASVWGPTARAAQSFAQDLQAEKWTTREEVLLRDPTIYMVVVWTAPSIQAVLFDKAVGLGKSVICGLPVAVDQTVVGHMYKATKEHQLLYMVAQGMRFLPVVIKARDLLSDGSIGTMRLCTVRLSCAPIFGDHFDWSCDSLMGGGVLALYGALIIDLLHHITKQKIAKVAGMMKTFNRQTAQIRGIRQITSDDFCVFEFENKEQPSCGVVTLDASGTSCELFAFEMTIQGSAGRIRLNTTDLYHCLASAAEEKLVLSDPVTKSDRERATGSPDGILESPLLCKGFLYMADALKLATSELNPEPLQNGASFDDWMYVQDVVDAIKRAAESRQWCKIPTKSRRSS